MIKVVLKYFCTRKMSERIQFLEQNLSIECKFLILCISRCYILVAFPSHLKKSYFELKGFEGKDKSFRNFVCFLELFFQKTHSL